MLLLLIIYHAIWPSLEREAVCKCVLCFESVSILSPVLVSSVNIYAHNKSFASVNAPNALRTF